MCVINAAPDFPFFSPLVVEVNEAVPFGELWRTEEDDWVNTLLLLLVLLSSAFLRLSLFVGEDESRVLFFGKVVSDIITVIVFVFVFVLRIEEVKLFLQININLMVSLNEQFEPLKKKQYKIMKQHSNH